MAHALLPLIFLVCLPFYLLPAYLGFHFERRRRWALLLLNLFTFAVPVILTSIGGLILGVLAALILWLVLLHLALKKDLPSMAQVDEDVALVAHDPQWPADFERERARIIAVFELPAQTIEHIGSTAVPGLIAKPVIDMMLGVPQMPPAPNLVSRLEILGYENLGEAGVPGRTYLRLRGDRNFNLHIVERGGAHWVNNLALRDLLLRDPAARERYAAAKRAALDAGATRLLAYSAAKNSAVAELLASARQA
jgi:GrpB-like predicted nucleotidyltransferase (UPF0157 family)